jgi:type III restriction enzyme
VSEIKKRQEVGRGIRLCRNQAGERVHDERINVLTVIANESYERYVGRLQAEVEEEYGAEGVPPRPANARRRGTARLRKGFTLRPEFKELWHRIKDKTRYAVKIDSERLLAAVIPEIDKLKVRPPRVAITKAQVRVGATDTFEALQMSAAKTAVDLIGRYPLPNLVEIMSNQMEHTTPSVRLTRKTLLEVFRRTSNKAPAVENPHEFATGAVRVIKERLADHLVDGIQYEKVNEWYEMTQFEAEIESWESFLVPTNRSIYDQVELDSQIERDFVEGLERRDDVKLYVKLPAWFTVQTPVGEYNPDWAIVVEDRDAHGESTGKPLLYLVRETKGKNWQTELRPSERRKILCGERHFKNTLGVDYKVVSNANEV